MSQRKGGIISVNVNNILQDGKGDFEYNPGRPKRTAVIGSSGVHGFSEEPQPAFIAGKITDRGTLDFAALVETEDATVTLELANGKMFALSNAWYAGEGTGNTKEGEIDFRFEAVTGEES